MKRNARIFQRTSSLAMAVVIVGMAGMLSAQAADEVTQDRLLNADMVTRQDNPRNRREVVLGLTEQGRQVVREVTSARRAEITRIVRAMPASQRAGLIKALRAFAEAAGEPEPDAGAMATLGW